MTWNSPFDHPSYKKPAKKKAKKKRVAKKKAAPKKKAKKKAKPKKARKREEPLYEKYETPGPSGSCLRSPCRPWDDPDYFMDPKVGLEEVKAAMEYVKQGSPKLKRRIKGTKDDEVIYARVTGPRHHIPGDGNWPLTVALGMGVDSVAILVGLAQLSRLPGQKRRWTPKAITFADPGGELHSTYALLGPLSKWLKKVGFPPVTICANSTGHTRGGWGTGVTLEMSCVNNHTLPSIAYPKSGGGAGHSCSIKYKIEAQEPWLFDQIRQGKLSVPRGGRLIRAIGYDATEGDRLTRASTYSGRGEEEKGFRAWYPLLEWGWDRSRCIAEIIREFAGSYEVNKKTVKVVPRKSSCFFCAAMKPFEIAALPKDLLKRAIFMEEVARHGRHGLKTVGGLGGNWSWADFALGKIPQSAYTRQAVIYGVVYKQLIRGPREGQWVRDYYGRPRGKLKKNQHHQPGTGPLLTKGEHEKIVRQAKAWVAATKGLKKKDLVDAACLAATRGVPAFEEILGFRGEPFVTHDSLRDKLLAGYEEELGAARVELEAKRELQARAAELRAERVQLIARLRREIPKIPPDAKVKVKKKKVSKRDRWRQRIKETQAQIAASDETSRSRKEHMKALQATIEGRKAALGCLPGMIGQGKRRRRARRNPRRLPVVPQNILLLGGQDD